MPSIQVRKGVYERLCKLKGYLEINMGRPVSFSDVIEFLMSDKSKFPLHVYVPVKDLEKALKIKIGELIEEALREYASQD